MIDGGRCVNLSLLLVDETPTMIIGDDEMGDRRAFPRDQLKTCVINRRFEAVSVVMRYDDYRRLPKLKADVSPESDAAVPKIKRNCLTCNHLFDAHPAHRICGPCKATDLFQHSVSDGRVVL